MDKMSIIALLTVSIPDNIIALLFILATCGETRYINRNLPTILKFTAINLLSLVLIYLIRLLSPNIIVCGLAISLAYSCLVKIFYSSIDNKWLLTSSLGYLLCSGIMETLYVPASLTSLNLSIQEVYRNDLLRFYLSLPKLFVCILAVVLIIKYQNVRKGIAFYINSKKILRSILSINFVAILSLYYLFLTYFITMNNTIRILFCAILIIISLSNILIFKLVATIVQESYTKIQIEKGSKVDVDIKDENED